MTASAVNRKSAPARRAKGFTLVEMMTTILVAAILALLAAPSFVQYVATSRVRNASYDLTTALQIARSEAIKRNAAIDVVRTVGGDWSGGWKVQVPAGPVVIRQQDAYSALAITDSANLSTITYGNDGRTTTASTNFTIQPSTSISGVTVRCVRIGLSGVATSKSGSCT